MFNHSLLEDICRNQATFTENSLVNKSVQSIRLLSSVTVIILILTAFTSSISDWGFYGHRLINKMAVFTLPQEMLPVFKKHIFYISQHAVDPDKRRYALKNEAYRHYIDIDHWDTIPFPNVPRDLKTAILSHAALVGITTENDTVILNKSIRDLDSFYYELVLLDRYSKSIDLAEKDVQKFLDRKVSYAKYQFLNPFVGYGVLPYFLEDYYKILVRVLEEGKLDDILKVSADIGHYLGDAHVPLHTTVNYNGQLTDQLGIHAFWESRLPELFAEEEYDMVVGKAVYISDMSNYFWSIIMESHSLLEEVLEDELVLKETYPSDEQYCYDDRLERTTRVECPEYAAAYHNSLDGMVEKRMQDAILSIGSVWYSAWIDAGQPDLTDIVDNRDLDEIEEENKSLNEAANNNEINGRSHDN